MSDLIDGLVLLKDNRNLSQKEFLQAKQVCKTILSIIDSRDEYIKSNKLDREFCMPSALWSYLNEQCPIDKRPFLKLFNLVAKVDYDVINRLKLIVGPFFTGYSLSHLCIISESLFLTSWLFISDSKLSECLANPDDWCFRWMQTASAVPLQYIYNPPRFLGEIGWNVRGVAVNHDTYYFQEALNLFYESGIFDFLSDRVADAGIVRILEIGGGYGALASAIKTIIPNSEYWICDLPESLLMSSLWLTLTRADNDHQFIKGSHYGFTYLPNYMIHSLEGKFDLVINRLSLSEMSEHQIRTYAQIIRTLIGEGIFFEQNCDNRNIGGHNIYGHRAELIIEEYFPCRQVIKNSVPDLLMMRGGNPNIWSNQPVNLCKGKTYSRLFGGRYKTIHLVKDQGDYNIVQVDDSYVACLKELGHIDLGSEGVGQRDLPPYFYIGSSINDVISKVKKLNNKKNMLPI
ncbi:MAG: putative sugar O-methyltransferase [Nitrospirae bacterium]|nr:putative sugar O-methyltransferase [Nitrospirota bacterium]